MSIPSSESLAERRALLTAQIALQRGALAEAYRNLAKPIQYGENAMRGFGFLRENSWVFVAVPAVFSVASSLLGLRKKKPAKPSLRQRQEMEGRPKGFVGHAVRWGGHGWRLFRLYRRLRHFLLP